MKKKSSGAQVPGTKEELIRVRPILPNMERVAWVPGWYELDPQLEVGLEDEFAFWRVVPDHLRGPERLVLYNDLWHPENVMLARGKITGIRHPELGEIRKVDTRGLDYSITLADGAEVVVNAEEDPGKMYEGKPGAWLESKRVVSHWRFEVEFESLSESSAATTEGPSA
jgi:hypothetical protein